MKMNTISSRISEKLTERKWYHRIAAITVALSLLCAFFVPLDLMELGFAATDSDVPAGAYSIENDITGVSINEVSGGTASGATITGNAGSDSVTFSMIVNFVINDRTHDKIDSSKPYIYLPISKEELEILTTGSNTGEAMDSSTGWTNWRQNNPGISPNSGTYTVYPTGDGSYGYVVLQFNQDYINYVKSSNGIVTGSLKFNGKISRDAAQNGDKDVSVGNASIKVNFDEREPKVDKTVVQSKEANTNCPILTWTISVSDLYETNKYVISDDMLADAYDITADPEGVVYFTDDGQIRFENDINHIKNFTITYKTRVTPEQLAEHTSDFTISNSVKLNDEVQKTVEETIHPDSEPKVSKSGTPDYLYNGSRSGEQAGKDYIYWTVNVSRNYGLSLAGSTLNDTLDSKLSNITFVSAENEQHESLELSDLFTSTSGTSWTFKNTVTEDNVTLVYRTEVSEDAEVSNSISIGNSPPSTPTVNYQRNAQHQSSKSGNYVSVEDPVTHQITEYVDWTIEIKAVDGTYETINDYSIYDSAFDMAGLVWKSVEAKNDGQNLTVSADSIFNGSGTTRTITSSPVMDYLKVTYRVPLGEIAGRDATHGGSVSNTYKVEKDDETTVSIGIPSLVGQSTVHINKIWNNSNDLNKGNTTATFTLYCKVGENGTWQRFSDYSSGASDTITVNGNESGGRSFTDLPAYDVNGTTRTALYYKVEESVSVPAGVTNLYQQSITSGNVTNGEKGADNPTFGITNTWEGTNVEGVKYWRDDEGHEGQRPVVSLTLQQRKANSSDVWADVSLEGVENPKSAAAASDWKALWSNLPVKDPGGNLLEYRVTEKTPPAGYTMQQNSNTTITNIYDNLTITAKKLWDRVDSEADKPESIKVKLMRTTNRNDADSWVDVENSTIELQKENYNDSQTHLKWADLPKKDPNENTYYYKVVEVQETEKQQEFDVSYSLHNSWGDVIDASQGSQQMDITNTWKKTNITVSKQWQDDRGNEFYRPNIVMVLEKSVNSGDWVEVDRVKLVNDGSGNFKPEGSADEVQAGQTYTWKKLDAGDGIRYRVREAEMYERQRGGSDPGKESGNLDTGYDTYYGYAGNTEPGVINSTGDQNSRNQVIINKSNMITIRVDKVWEGAPADYRADMVGYRLYYWNETQYNTLSDEEKYTDTYKFSDKYAFKSASGESDTIYWTWMLTHDQNGEKYYYGLKEIAVKDPDPGIPEPSGCDDYTVDRSSEFKTEVIVSEVVNQNQTITVKNTWNKMNVSISKVWENGTNAVNYSAIEMKLMMKIGDDGQWQDVPVPHKTVSAANNWRIDDAWTELPRETDQGQKFYYRAEEVKAIKTDNTEVAIADNEDFYTRPDAAGINATGDSVVTNTPKKITVDVLKHWVSTQGTPKPAEINITLMASTNGGASWASADTIDSSITPVKTLTVDGNNDLTDRWSGLPTKKVVGGVERDVIYKLVEGDVSGYSASYSPETVHSNSTVTITNTEISPYTKKAANYAPSINPQTSTYDDNGVTKTRLDGIDLIPANDGILQNNTLSSDELTKVDTAMVNINGVETECYLFKWRIDMPLNQTSSTTGYIFTDTLTDGSVFYDDAGEHGIVLFTNVNVNPQMYRGRVSEVYGSNGYYPNGNDPINITYNDDMTSATFDTKNVTGGNSVYYITYYTATPKSVVDAAIGSNGEFILSNRIKEENESTPTVVDLNVTGGNNIGYIDKINNTADGITNGRARMSDGIAHYTLDINSDSKYLSSGNTVSVTDIFRILDYTPEGGAEQIGRDVTAVPTITNVGVFYYDTDGKRTRVTDTSLYSYSTSEEPGSYDTTLDYSDKFTNANLSNYNSLVVMGGNYPKGLEVTILLSGGDPNQKWTLNRYNSGLFYNNRDDVLVEFPNSDFSGNDTDGYSGYCDNSGNVLVKLTFLNDVNLTTSTLQLDTESGELNITSRMVQSAILKSSIPCKNYLTKFTLPDGGHYEIMYDFVIKNEDGSSLASGSSLTLQNEAIVHTSGGDKTDESTKTTFTVQESEVTTRVGQNFEIVKVDIGNQSINDLNAEFKLAKFDKDANNGSGEWIYANAFRYKTITAGSTSYLSDTLHEALYDEGLTETDEVSEGNTTARCIPSEAANMVLSGNYEIELDKTVLYKIIEVKAPDNHENFEYPKTPYESPTNDHTVSGNADNTYYFVYNESGDGATALTDAELTALAANAGIAADQIQVRSSNDPSVIVKNVRNIDIGAEKTWEQDPNSAVNDVKVAVQLLRSDTKDIGQAVPVEDQKDLLDEGDKADFDDGMNAYILKKENAWKQTEIWHDLPNGNIETGKPYFYFVKEVAYKIGDSWYRYDDDSNSSTCGKYVDANGSVWKDASGHSAEYKPSYADDAISSSGVIRIVNSRKLLVKKQWQDRNGDPVADPPVASIDFNLYGITSDGTEVKITLPEDRQKLTAPNWEIEVPQDLISGEGIDYIKFRVEEVTELEDYIVSDVYALNGNTGVMYLINKNTNPTSVDINVSKTWADGNDAHDTDDAVTFTLYQFTGKQTVNQAFIEHFISKNKTYNGVTEVTGVTNPVTLDGTETDAWKYSWKNLPFRGGIDNSKLQYFVVEQQSETTEGDYVAIYTLDGNSTYKAERNLDVTNKQPGVLVVKKQWRDKMQQGSPLIPNSKNTDVQVKLYHKAKADPQVVDEEAENIMAKYGLTDAGNLVTGMTTVEGLSEDGIITLGVSNAWTVSLKGLDENYCYYIVETDGKGYTVEDYAPEYANEGQLPGSDKIMTVDNFVEGETITAKAKKTWSYDSHDGTLKTPDSITLDLQQYDVVNQKWITIQSQIVNANSGSGWEAEWTELPATKQYRVIEEVPTGWEVDYGDEAVDTSGDIEVRSYPMTNVLDTGELNVKKNWLANDPGSVTSVNVELWRQAYDGDEPYTPPAVQAQQQTQSSHSLPKNMFSMRRVQKALAETKTDRPVVQTEVEKAPAQMPLAMPRGGIKLLGDGTDPERGAYVSYENPIFGTNDLSSVLSTIDTSTISGVTLVISGAGSFNGRVRFDNVWSYPGCTQQNLNVVAGQELDIGVPPTINNTIIIEDYYNSTCTFSEIRFYYTPKVTIGIQQPGSIVEYDDPLQLNATTPTGTVTWTLVDENGNPAQYGFASLTSGGLLTTTGAGTIYVKAQDSVSHKISDPIVIVPFSITNKSQYIRNQTEGNTDVDLNANASANWTTDDSKVATVDSNGVVTFIANGDVTIKATHGGATDTVSFKVSGFTPFITPSTVHEGGTAELSADEENVTWALKQEGNTGEATLVGNTVTAISAGKVTFIGTLGSAVNEAILTIVEPIKVTYNNENVIPECLTVNVRSSIPVVNVVGASSGTLLTGDENIAYYDPETQTVKTGEKVGEATITITDEGGGSLTFTVKTVVTEANANIPSGAAKVQDITISATNDWLSSTVSGLPKTDGLGHTYRYFIREEATDAFIPVSYSTNSQGAELGDTMVQLDLTNASQLSESVELPTSGSTGTRIYYLTGGVMLLLAAAGYTMYKRRRWSDE